MTKPRRKERTGPGNRSTYGHTFVDTLPEKLDEGVLYVSVRYATSAHNCFCGCGREVVTPIHPTKWRLTFDGVHISLSPSVGSWSLACRSQYVLQDGKVKWAENWSDDEIEMARAHDSAALDSYFGQPAAPPSVRVAPIPEPTPLWRQFAKWLLGK
jgi:Family of unknown function (DUF6527)